MLDTEEKDLTAEKIELLKIIASEIVSRLESTKEIRNLQGKVEELKETQRKVSHDIRGPLGGIIGLSELIKEKGRENKIDEILEMMDLIEKGGTSILELAEEILGASDLKQPGENEFNLKNIQTQAGTALHASSQNKRCEF